MTEGGTRLSGPHGLLAGRLPVPPSKSLTNRALIAAAVAGGGMIVDPLDCEDTRLLAAALQTAGWAVRWTGQVVTIGRMRPVESLVTVDLGNSGTGARLLLALLASIPGHFIVDGSPRLRQRPMEPLIHALRTLGARMEASNNRMLPVSVEGQRLRGGRTDIRPGVSSQFVTALLMAAPLFLDGLELRIVGPLPSEPYLELTHRVLGDFGAEVERSSDNRQWKVSGGGLKQVRWCVEGDWSAAAFPIAAAAVAGGWVAVPGLDRSSAQGDRIICNILADAGMIFEWFGDRLVAKGPITEPIFADLGASPDVFPALAAVAACRVPGSKLKGLGNLLHKESSRLQVMATNLRTLGARVVVDEETFEVEKTVDRREDLLRPVQAADDHRIAMAMAVTALEAGPLELDSPSSVAKSFPDFWRLWNALLRGEESPG